MSAPQQRDPQLAEAVEAVIRARRTEKVLCDVDSAQPTPAEAAARNQPLVRRAIEAAGWAPFHFPRGVGGIAEPWRAHVVWGDGATRLARFLRDDLGDTGKLPLLAAACNALVLVTWLPETGSTQSPPGPPRTPAERAARDQEHLAAAAAMVQNLLLLLTAHGMGTYWSSGGGLRNPVAARRLGVAEGEQLLAAVFVEYPELRGAARDRKPGGLRERRTTAWLREVPA